MAYGTEAGLIAYLAQTGRVLPAGMAPDVARLWGSMYVNSFEGWYRGNAVALPDSFPRDLWPVVPVAVEYATYEAALAYAQGIDLFGGGGSSGGQVKREKLDVMEQEFFGPQDGQSWWDANHFIWRLAYQYLVPYMKQEGKCCGASGGGGFVV